MSCSTVGRTMLFAATTFTAEAAGLTGVDGSSTTFWMIGVAAGTGLMISRTETGTRRCRGFFAGNGGQEGKEGRAGSTRRGKWRAFGRMMGASFRALKKSSSEPPTMP